MNSSKIKKISKNKIKLLSNISWAALGKIVNIVSGLLVGVIVARYLGPEQFGLMNYVISYVTLFSVLANFGLDNIEVRELTKRAIDSDQLLGTTFFIRLFFSSITILLIWLTLILFETNSEVRVLVLIYSSSIILSTSNNIRNFFTAKIENKLIVLTEINRAIIGSIIKVLLLIYEAPLIWFIIASSFDFLLITAGYVTSYHRRKSSVLHWRFNKSEAKYLLKESLPLLISGTAIMIYQRIDQVMIRSSIGEAALGQFSAASKIMEFAVFVPVVICQTVTPMLVAAHQNSLDEYRAKCLRFMRVMTWIGIGISLAVMLSSKLAVTTLFGSQYSSAHEVLQIMSWKALGFSLFAVSSQMIIIEGLQKLAMLRNILGCLVAVGLNYILIPHLGINGSALASVFTILVAGFLANFFIRSFREIFYIQLLSFIPSFTKKH